MTSGGRAERSRESGVWVLFDMEVDVGLPEEEAAGDFPEAGMVEDVWRDVIILGGFISFICRRFYSHE